MDRLCRPALALPQLPEKYPARGAPATIADAAPARISLMSRRTRQLVGTLALIGFVIIYGPLAMALAESRIMEAPKLVQALAYLVLGLVWIVPLMPLIRWMARPDRDPA